MGVSGLDDDDCYRMQVALVLDQALMLTSEASAQQFLVQNLALHNVSEYVIHNGQPCKYVLALTDGRLKTTAECKTVLKLQPTMYLICGDYQSPSEPHDSGAQFPGLALHYSSMRATALPDIPAGACAHGLASWVADALPLQSLFNYLGQGYHVVLGGHGFGGMVAHTLAVRLLLSVRQEINMAKQLGVNLSALAQTEEKVSSFAFCAPLMASWELATALQDQGLASRLHTIWRTRDASPHYFTLCSELATSVEGSLASDGLSPPTYTTMPFNLRSPQLQSANDAASKIAREISNRPGRSRGHQPVVCAPLELGTLVSIAAANTGVPVNVSVPPAADPPAARTSCDYPIVSSPALGSSPTAGAAGRLTPVRRMPSTVVRAATKVKSAIDKVSAANATNYASASPQRGEHGKSNPGTGTITTQLATDSKGVLAGLLSKGAGIDKSSQYAPLGAFWLLDAPPLPKLGTPGQADAEKPATTAKPASKADAKGVQAAALVMLKPLAEARVLASRGEWLTDLNPDLYGCWEWSLEELRKELMEAFAWVMFRVAVNVDGQVISREAIIKPSRALLLE